MSKTRKMAAPRTEPNQTPAAPDPTQTDAIPIRIGQIARVPGLQVRQRIDEGTVKKYASCYRAGVNMPPVEVAEVDGAYILVDGWHRVAALEINGTSEVSAVIRRGVSLAEAQWLAAKANTAHGLPLRPRELRSVFQAFVHARMHRKPDGSFKSYRDIATELGGGRAFTTIRSWMAKDFPSVFRAMSKDDEEPFEGTGGLTDAAPTPVADAVRGYLSQINAAVPAITDRIEQGEIMRDLQRILERVGRAGWKPLDDNLDF